MAITQHLRAKVGDSRKAKCCWSQWKNVSGFNARRVAGYAIVQLDSDHCCQSRFVCHKLHSSHRASIAIKCIESKRPRSGVELQLPTMPLSHSKHGTKYHPRRRGLAREISKPMVGS